MKTKFYEFNPKREIFYNQQYFTYTYQQQVYIASKQYFSISARNSPFLTPNVLFSPKIALFVLRDSQKDHCKIKQGILLIYLGSPLQVSFRGPRKLLVFLWSKACVHHCFLFHSLMRNASLYPLFASHR